MSSEEGVGGINLLVYDVDVLVSRRGSVGCFTRRDIWRVEPALVDGNRS